MRGLWLSEQLAAVPEFHGLGPLFKSSPEPVALTESETEYVIRCTKHTFTDHMVFQVSTEGRGSGPESGPTCDGSVGPESDLTIGFVTSWHVSRSLDPGPLWLLCVARGQGACAGAPGSEGGLARRVGQDLWLSSQQGSELEQCLSRPSLPGPV